MTSDHSPHSHDRDPALPFEDAARRAHQASLDFRRPGTGDAEHRPGAGLYLLGPEDGLFVDLA